MALRALTPGKAAFCSECGAEALPEAKSCTACHATFEGYMDAVLCPLCNAVNRAEASECAKCSAKFPVVADTDQLAFQEAEEAYLRRILQLSREKARARTARSGSAATLEPRSMLESGGLDDLEKAVWKLAEPFDRMVRNRRRRLEQMEALVERARNRIKELADTKVPSEVHEREGLKRRIEELLLEKEDILKLEEGLVEMENIYRNILRMQQEELKARETSLRGRLDAFQRELETRERSFGKLRERESDMVRREDEFRRLMNRLHEREQDLNPREELLREKARLLDERHHALSEAEVDLERRRWEIQKKSMAPAVAPSPSGGTITVRAPDRELNDLRSRLTELEEEMERLTEEKNQLALERTNLASLRDEMKEVMGVLDGLLGELPEEKIREFAKSNAFSAYEKILQRLGVG